MQALQKIRHVVSQIDVNVTFVVFGADWLVDALTLHDDVPLLAPLFCNPAILKVLLPRSDI